MCLWDTCMSRQVAPSHLTSRTLRWTYIHAAMYLLTPTTCLPIALAPLTFSLALAQPPPRRSFTPSPPPPVHLDYHLHLQSPPSTISLLCPRHACPPLCHPCLLCRPRSFFSVDPGYAYSPVCRRTSTGGSNLCLCKPTLHISYLHVYLLPSSRLTSPCICTRISDPTSRLHPHSSPPRPWNCHL